MTLAMAERPQALDAKAIERVLVGGDLSKLTDEQRLNYYNGVCQSLGLNPLTQPFAYITLNGKLRLYALKDATEQLRKIHGVSITELTSQRIEDVFVVTAKAQDKSGRTDAATGAVAVGSLKGEALANALMKAETKAKRRATLSICGLGILDEAETDTLPNAPTYTVEAVAQIAPFILPAGTVRILKVIPKTYGGDVLVVDEHGEEQTYPCPDRQNVALCEQIAQDEPPVPVRLQLVIGARDKKTKIKEVHRWMPTTVAEDAPVKAMEQAEYREQPIGITSDDIPF